MKIVDRATFLAMPKGTLYSKYAPCYFSDLLIKEETLSEMTDQLAGDWYYSNIIDGIECNDSGEWDDLLDESQETGRSLVMDYDSLSRDGCFDRGQLFAVYEKEDLRKLIEKLVEIS